MQVGRVLHGRIGFLGVDDAFHDDGRFHPANAAAGPQAGLQPAFAATGLATIGDYAIAGSVRKPALQTMVRFDLVHPAVASAYQGCASSTIEFATCPRRDLRTLVAGFIGPGAGTITVHGDGVAESEHVTTADDGFYLFVLARPWTRKLRFTVAVACLDGLTSTGSASPDGVGSDTAHCTA